MKIKKLIEICETETNCEFCKARKECNYMYSAFHCTPLDLLEYDIENVSDYIIHKNTERYTLKEPKRIECCASANCKYFFKNQCLKRD